jgi:hypothetical protein
MVYINRERSGNLPVPLKALAGRNISDLEEEAMKGIKDMREETKMLHIPEGDLTAKSEGGSEYAEEEKENGEGREEQAVEDQGGYEAWEPPAPDLFDDDDTVYLGLHVYTNRDAPSKVDGQLRHEMGVLFHGMAATSFSGGGGK